MKFPSTPHLAVLDGASIRDDKVLSVAERDFFLSHEVTAEEKIDGANLGISFRSDGVLLAQNRGSVLSEPMTGQWKKLPEWLSERREALFDVLTDQYILFGEWCYATHSVFYNSLPDWFIGFDVFDLRSERFLCKTKRDVCLSILELHAVPCIAAGRMSLAEITGLFGRSRFGDEMAEGLYLRYDDHNWLNQRAKLVRPAFIQSIDSHWSRGPLTLNRLAEQKDRIDEVAQRGSD
jgi:ATP-dependent RNA circularization protein (DNA/RNA ligase family)